MIKVLAVAVTTAMLFSCNSSHKMTDSNKLTSEEKSQGWQLLFDGSSTKGWHTYGKSTVGSSWQAVGGTLHFNAADTKALSNVYQSIDLEWKREPKLTEITALLAALSSALLVVGAACSLLWFGRVV